jgi:hypothetical protein
MRFTVTGEWKRNSLLRLIIVSFLVYGAALWLTNALLYFAKMNLTYQSVVDYYLGSEARFTHPRTYQGLLEVTHFHVFAMGIFILTMAHLLLFVPMRARIKLWVISLSFLAGLADEGAGWLVRFVSPAFAYLKIAAFLLLQGTLGVLLIAVLVVAVGGGYRNAYTDDLAGSRS